MKTKRNVYLNMMPIDTARELLLSHFPDRLRVIETIPVDQAVNRTLSEPVWARLSSPGFHAAAMDGMAVMAEDTFGASPARPRQLQVGKNAFPVNTGHVLPPETNAVIMIEQIIEIDETTVQIEAPVFPWQYVRKTGEDIVATELLFPQGHTITPYCIGALISGGVFSVSVFKRPRILMVPTGSELVYHQDLGDKIPASGQVIESNSYVLKALAEKNGADVNQHPHVGDDKDLLSESVTRAASDPQYDMILLMGGSSAGSEDFTKAVLTGIGELWVHGVTMMPGKPVLFGAVNGKPVFGIPGYPVSAIVAFEQFVAPLIHRMAGTRADKKPVMDVQPIRKIASKLGVEEFVRVKIGKVGERMVATPIPGGAGSITSITEADGYIRIPAHVEGLNALATVKAELLRPKRLIENTVVIVGSHDNTLDILADQIRSVGDYGDISLSSSHVGSMGGIMALKKRLCHLAGSHLLDETDGSYNLSYIRKYLPDTKVKVVNLVLREQGLIIPKGNPKQIRGMEDLCRKGIRFINRQPGSGTRILLDYKLKQAGLDHNLIDGYTTDEYTHMSVAVAVLSGAADVGLGIFAAARALDLDFIPIVTEQYDLIVDEAYWDSRSIRILLDTVNSKAFKDRVMALGGYITEKTGSVIQ